MNTDTSSVAAPTQQTDIQKVYTVVRMGSSMIMIGATQSSSIKLRFAFLINGSKMIESPTLDMRIKNPVGANLHHRYKDGDEMRRALLSNVTSSKHELPAGMRRDESERLGSFPFSRIDGSDDNPLSGKCRAS